jgi:peroxiredoxin Q/BCP
MSLFGKSERSRPGVGDEAPDFELPDHTGAIRKLSDYRGRNVVLWFYPAASTPGWTKEGRGFRDLYDDFRRKNTEVLGASFDSVEKNARFAEKQGFPFPLLCDTDRKLGLAYGACDSKKARFAERISYVIGPDGRIAAAYPKVSPASHPKEVLDSL